MDMQKRNVLCRACLRLLVNDDDDDEDSHCTPKSIEKHDLFLTPDLAKKFAVCTALNVDVQDGFPQQLCDSCFGMVEEFHRFQVMCVKSDQRFRESLQLRESLDKNVMEDEDEKPVYDLHTQLNVEIIVGEANVLFQSATEVEAAPTLRQEHKKKKTPVPDKGHIETNDNRNDDELKANEHIAAEWEQSIKNINNKDNDWPISAATSSDDSENECRMRRTRARTKAREVKEQNVGRKAEVGALRSTKSSTTSSSVFQCNLCSMRFFVEHRLIAHKRSHHEGLVPYPCPRNGCDRSFNRWHCLSEHLKQHEGTNQWYACEETGCGKVYKHKPTLQMHLRKYHKRGPELKSHVCEICGKVFKSSAILNDHRYTHKDKSELPYACAQPQCQRRFSNKEKLKVHLLRHAGIKNFICPYCGMRKTTKNELKIHTNYHTLERTWPCRFCAHVCNSAGNLKMHVRTVHERAKDYACRYCEKTFAKPDTRKYHEMTHTGEKPNECHECGKRFTQPAALRTHKKIHQRQRMQSTGATVVADTEVRSDTADANFSTTLTDQGRPKSIPLEQQPSQPTVPLAAPSTVMADAHCLPLQPLPPTSSAALVQQLHGESAAANMQLLLHAANNI